MLKIQMTELQSDNTSYCSELVNHHMHILWLQSSMLN